ncbi:MAG: SDR family oxidoreductase [Planctomycetes bacterium]|nr:SDR family oxidoreductase [Planctomycetota bacterium]
MAADVSSLPGRVAWVTGAARGIGLAVAQALRAAGARVVGMDLRGSAELAACCETVRELDVSSFAAVEEAAAELAAQGLAPDVLVNNAGITRDGVLWKLTEADWDAVLDVNLKGAFNLLRHGAPLMRAHNRGGSVVNITSINGIRGQFGQSNYSASKAGMIGLTKAAARELGKAGIRVNAVAPGMVETEMAAGLPAEVRQKAMDETLLGRLAQPADIANCVLFLASDLGRHITGQVIQVDGGQRL